jgi:hypothetical protein
MGSSERVGIAFAYHVSWVRCPDPVVAARWFTVRAGGPDASPLQTSLWPATKLGTDSYVAGAILEDAVGEPLGHGSYLGLVRERDFVESFVTPRLAAGDVSWTVTRLEVLLWYALRSLAGRATYRGAGPG